MMTFCQEWLIVMPGMRKFVWSQMQLLLAYGSNWDAVAFDRKVVFAKSYVSRLKAAFGQINFFL